MGGEPQPLPNALQRACRRGSDSRTHNLHVVEMPEDRWDQGLVFRDYLRASPETARGYARLTLPRGSVPRRPPSVCRGRDRLRLRGSGAAGESLAGVVAGSGPVRGPETAYFTSVTSSV
ncbi:MAG: GrpB family protein [Rubrobacter sp.]|nr:GrpB family protein [Rubrobacter sp.]